MATSAQAEINYLNMPSAAVLMAAEDLLEVGKLYFDRCEFDKATDKLTRAAELFYLKKEFAKYLTCQNLLLRGFAEREMQEEIHATKEKLQDLVLREGFELTAKTYYTLSVCAAFRGQFDTGLEYLQKSLALALATDNKEDICYAIMGIAISYRALGKLPEALKEIYNLQVFFQFIELPEVRIASQILNARILTELQKYDQALEILWQNYEELKKVKTINMHLQLLYNLARTYNLSGDKDSARMYAKLAEKMCDKDNCKVISGWITDLLADVGEVSKEAFDLVYQEESHSILEKRLGKVDFKNQFVLLDLLKLFMANPGRVYTKEYLVEQVWKQHYSPDTHDNKIYVTIKRLRKMIEPDFEKPKYIFRAKNGYFMNKSAKVLVESNVSGGI